MDSFDSISQPASPTQDTRAKDYNATDSAIPQQQRQQKQGYNTVDSRTMKLEMLREELQNAHIPFTHKRGSITEVPRAAEDCQFVPGTHRCSLTLCEDSCSQSHSHHFTHASRLNPQANLVYTRPSISKLPGSGMVSSYVSPSGSPIASTNTSPNMQYRRASAYGFNFGTRNSVTSVNQVGSGGATPADWMASGPPSPFSDSSTSPPTSAPVSPRTHHTGASTNETIPAIAEESKQDLAPSTQSALLLPSNIQSQQSTTDTTQSPFITDFWRLRDRIINLQDYRPEVVGKNTEETLTRRDLEPAPREDCPDQEEPFWDPRSPQPPSPVNAVLDARLVRVHVNEDQSKPEIEYELQAKPHHASMSAASASSK